MQIRIPIEILKLEDNSYHIIVEARFNDETIGSLIIDTGASKTVLDHGFVQPFIQGFEKVEEQTSSGINAMINEAYTGIVPKFEMGDFSINDYNTVLLDLSHINSVYETYTNKTIAGLLGSDFLLQYKAVIHYGMKQLKLTIK